jgi:uncharacterized protein
MANMPISTFPWTYDEQETCLLLEGDVSVTPEDGEAVQFGAGDLVLFAAGLSCTWEVHAPVRKHYRFGGRVSAARAHICEQ